MIKNSGAKKKDFVLKRRLRGLCFLIILISLWVSAAYGADYPTKPIQMICPFPPGGGTDVIARILNKKLSTLLGQPVVVVNKGGGGGTVGIQSVAAAPADGYTLLISAPTILVSPLTIKDLPFSFKNFTPITVAVSMPSVITIKKDAPWKTLEELIADAKKNPGTLTYSSAGPGTIQHIAGELFKIATANDITHVPMDGTGKAVSALLGGHVNMTFMGLGGVKTYIDAGSLRGLAVMSRNRLEEFPNVPTTVEKGYPKLISTTWHSIFVSAKTSSTIIKKLGEVFKEALKDKEVIRLLKNAGYRVENLGLEEAAKFLAEEEERLSEVIEVAKIGQ